MIVYPGGRGGNMKIVSILVGFMLDIALMEIKIIKFLVCQKDLKYFKLKII